MSTQSKKKDWLTDRQNVFLSFTFFCFQIMTRHKLSMKDLIHLSKDVGIDRCNRLLLLFSSVNET